jgi:hypothetical protein
MRYTTTIEIYRTVADAFSVAATDFINSYPKYCLAAKRVEQSSPGPLSVGTTGTITGRSAYGLQTVDFEVVAYEPQRLFSYESRYGEMSGRGSYVFEATPHGTTKLTITDQIDVRGGFRTLGFLLTKPLVKARARADARRLKALIETGQPPPAASA